MGNWGTQVSRLGRNQSGLPLQEVAVSRMSPKLRDGMSWQGAGGHPTGALHVMCDSWEMRSCLPFQQELALQSKTEREEEKGNV